MKKLLLIGANSFVGKRLAEQLQHKYKITGTYHKKKNEFLKQQEKLDLTKKEDAEKTLKKTKPSIIILAAAISSTSEAEEKIMRVNVLGASNLVNAAKAQSFSPKIIFFSTEQVFDGTKGLYTEKDKPAPINSYGKSKLEAEKTISSYPDHIILRCAAIMGAKNPGDHDNFITTLLESDKTFAVFSNVYRTTLYVDDIAPVIQTLLAKDYKGIINLSNRQCLSYAEMAKKIEKAFNIMKEYDVIECSNPAIPKKLGLDNARLQEMLDFKLTSFDEILGKIKMKYEQSAKKDR